MYSDIMYKYIYIYISLNTLRFCVLKLRDNVCFDKDCCGANGGFLLLKSHP